MHLDDYKKAEFELRFFNKRSFDEESRNSRHVKASLYKYALVQKKLGNEKKALEALKDALTVDSEDQKYVTDGDIYVEMSLSKKELGKNGHLADLKRAVKLGNTRAKGILDNR